MNSSRKGKKQTAAYYKGEPILNKHIGSKEDAAAGMAVEEDTLFVGMFCSKGITATVIPILAQAGKLDYDNRIMDYAEKKVANPLPKFFTNGQAQ